MEQLRNTAREGESWQEPGWFMAPASLIHVQHLCRTVSAPWAAFHVDGQILHLMQQMGMGMDGLGSACCGSVCACSGSPDEFDGGHCEAKSLLISGGR